MKRTKITLPAVKAHSQHKCLWKPHPELHHLELCSRKKCGEVRAVPFNWTALDELEAEFMGRQEELYQQRKAPLRAGNSSTISQ